MAVLLDDGRAVAFDLKDYSHVDHGYAATVHKAQGMTVDRVHVLATPGLDRHSAYVALSRHRESVELHYGEDDFADRSKLVRALSRERQKDMASDYTRDFADRRQIRLPEPVARQTSRAAERDPFGSLGAALAKRSAPVRDPFAGLALRAENQSARGQDGAKNLGMAVQRFARAAVDVVRLRSTGREPLPHQSEALRKAGVALDELRPHGSADLTSALNRDPSLVEDTAKGRTAAAIRQMVLEGELRTSPERRADRFVEDWRKLARRHEALRFDGDDAGARRTQTAMSAMGERLQRDPQLESLLRNRTRELGIDPDPQRSLSQTIQSWLSRSRQMDIGI